MIPNLGGLAHFWKRKPVNIYDTVFKLHSKVTVCFLVACILFLSANEYFGVRIDCLDSSGHKPHMDNYCWMQGTFISPKHFNGSIGNHMISYGVAAKHVPEADRQYQKYYQWVTVFLTLHALLFCIPAYCWKVWERRTLDRLCSALSDDFFPQPQKETALNHLYTFFLHSHYRIRHRLYAFHFLLAELGNLAVVAANLFLLNAFFCDFWWQFWPAVRILLDFDYRQWVSASARVFPRMAKCEFFYGGPSGSVQSLQPLCLLPLNVLNEKVYAGVYVWFLALFCVSALNVAWKLLLLMSRPLRMAVIRAEYKEVPAYQWEAALDGGSYSQWFLFRLIAKNLSVSLVHTLADKLCHTDREEYYLK